MSIDKKQNRKEKAAIRKAERNAPKEEAAYREQRDYSIDNTPANTIENPMPEEIRDVNGGALDPKVNPDLSKSGFQVPETPETPANPAATTEVPATPTTAEEKPKTLADYLGELRKKAEDEKTSSAKMQKYYALTDALKALGDMSSTAVGGIAGGGAMDAPYNIAEYKPNRGYLEAIEKAKKADERLRALDDKGFQLAIRDEDRSFQQQMAKENRDFQRQMAEINAQRQEALAENNHKRAMELLEKKNELQTAHDEKITNLRYQYETSIKNISKEIVKMQTSGKKTQLWFDDGSKAEIGKDDYEALKRHIIGKRVGGTTVTKENVDHIISANPQYISGLMATYGIDGYTPAQLGNTKTVQPKAQSQPAQPTGMTLGIGLDTYNQYEATHPSNYVEVNPDFENEEFNKKFGSKEY
jgi:hypothetical protein